MEFDNTIKLKEAGSLDFTSDQPFESVHKQLWDICSGRSSHVGDGGNGEYWLDYPAPLRTRHLVVNLEETDPGQFRLRLRAGSKPDYLCDVLLGFLVLAAFWCLGKLFVPAPSFLYTLGFIAAVAAAAGLYVWSGKGFGGKETAALTEAVREAFHTEKA